VASARDRDRHTHAAADTQTREPLLRVAPEHLVQQRDEDAAPGGAKGVADGNRTALILEGSQSTGAIDRNRLRGKGLVDFQKVELLVPPPRLSTAWLADHRAHAHDLGIQSGGALSQGT
jgi:hypothetical protein